MPTFKELKEKAHVQKHPLFSKADARVAAMRKNMSRTAKGVDLGDLFSQRKNVGLQSEDRTLRAFVQEATLVARQALDVCDFPLQPRLSYNNSKNVRVASHDDTQVVDAEILFNVRISTVSGAIRQALLPVNVKSGVVIPPSTILYEQRMRILAQSTIDEIIERSTSYALQPTRRMYAPPLVGEELDRAVEERNLMGYQPREVLTDADGVRRTYNRGAQLVAPSTEAPAGVYFEEGDTILFDAGDGQYNVATVTQRIADLGGGRPGFRGIDPRTGMETYGFEDSVVDVLPGDKDVTIARRSAQDFDKKDWGVEGRPKTENAHGLLEERGHDPKDLNSGDKRDLSSEPERKKKREQDENSGKESQRLMAKMNSTERHWYGVYLSEGDDYRTAFVKAMELSRKDAKCRKEAVWPFDGGKVTPRKVKKIVKQQMPGAMERAIQQALPGAIAPQIQEQLSKAFPEKKVEEQDFTPGGAGTAPPPAETLAEMILQDPHLRERASTLAQLNTTPEGFANSLSLDPSFYGAIGTEKPGAPVDWPAVVNLLLDTSLSPVAKRDAQVAAGSATMEAYDLISTNPEHVQELMTNLGGGLPGGVSPQVLGQGLQAEYGPIVEVTDENTGEVLDPVNWDEVATMVMSPAMAANKRSQVTKAENPYLQLPDIGSDPTMLSQVGPVPMELPVPQTTQYETGSATEELYRQIVANTFIMDQVTQALNPPDQDVVDLVYASVSPLLATFNISPKDVEWFDLVNDLRSYVGSSTGAVTGEVHRKMALIIAEHLSGRRRFGKRRMASSLQEDAVDVALYIQAAKDTFSTREYAYADQLSQEALDALYAKDYDTTRQLVAELKTLFFDKKYVEVPHEKWIGFVARSGKRAEADVDQQIADMEGMGLRSGEEDPEDFELQRLTPPGYDLVLGDMVDAEEQGFDTFPRSYSHIEKNYILKRTPTCSRDAWYNHLVNDGFALNQWGTSRGRPRPEKKQGSRTAGTPYFVMVVKYEPGDPWAVEFGDYDKGTVKEELREYGYYNKADAKMITVPSDDQASIDRAVAELNAGSEGEQDWRPYENEPREGSSRNLPPGFEGFPEEDLKQPPFKLTPSPSESDSSTFLEDQPGEEGSPAKKRRHYPDSTPMEWVDDEDELLNRMKWRDARRNAQMSEDELIKQYMERADAERAAGGEIEYNDLLPSISIKLSTGEDYFFQEWQADELLDEVPDFIRGGSKPLIEDYLLAMAQEW